MVHDKSVHISENKMEYFLLANSDGHIDDITSDSLWAVQSQEKVDLLKHSQVTKCNTSMGSILFHFLVHMRV